MKHHLSIKSIHLCNKIIESGLIFLAFFTVFFFGAVEIWAYSIMEMVIFTLSLVWLLKVYIYKNSRRNNSHHSGNECDPHHSHSARAKTRKNTTKFYYVPLLLFFFLIILQLIPFSPKIIKLISPNTYELYTWTLPNYDQNQTQGSAAKGDLKDHTDNGGDGPKRLGQYRTLSINPYATKTILLRILAYVTIFFLVIHNFNFNGVGLNNSQHHRVHQKSMVYSNQPGKTREKCEFLIPGNRLIHIIIATGFLAAFLGILQELTNTNKIFWILKMPISARPFATFVNRNNFVGYINMIIPVVLVILVSQQSFIYGKKSHPRSTSATIKRFIVSLDPWVRRNGFYLLSAITMISALILTGSRGGILSFIIALGVFYFVNRFGARDQIRPLKALSPILFILAVILVAILWSNPNLFIKRFSKLTNFKEYLESAQRVQAYHAALKMVKDFPIVGAGLGSFPNLYFKYRGDKLANSIYVTAHSDYLQLLVETGLIGFGSIFLLISFGIFSIITHLSSDKRLPQRLLSSGIIAGISTMLFHSFIGYNIQIPANALLFSEIVGCAYILLQEQ